MRKTTITGLAAVAALVAATSAQAQVTVTFNTVTETFNITGVGTGTPGNSGSYPGKGIFVFERTDGSPTMPTTSVSYNDALMYGAFNNTPGNGTFDVQLTLFSPGSGTRMGLDIGLDNQNSGTVITGTGVSKSYAGLHPTAKTYIAGLNGLTLTANTSTYGGSWGSGPVNISVVPEPSTYALIAGLGLLGFAGYRRLCSRA